MTDRNENRPEYKKTKVGWIPIEWDTIQMNQFAHKDAPICYGILKPGAYVDDGVPVIKVTNYINGIINKAKLHRTSPEIDSAYKRSRLLRGDILFSIRGSVGDLTLVPPNLEGANITQDTARLRIKNSYTRDYLIHVLKSNFVRRQVELHTIGQAVKGINIAEVKRLLIPLPSIQEQKKIVEILSTWDAAIEQTRKLIDAKKRRKKALMQQLLTGRKRLPGFAKTKDRNSYRFFDLPADWKCPRIREVAEECSERNTQRDKLTVLSCSKHLGFVESSEYFGKRIFSEDMSDYKVIRRGCFGYPSNHIEEGSIGLLLNHDIGMVSPIYTVFKCSENVVPEFLFALFKTDTYRHIFAISTNASVDRRGSLRWREFSLIQVPTHQKKSNMQLSMSFKPPTTKSTDSKENLKPWKNKNAA